MTKPEATIILVQLALGDDELTKESKQLIINRCFKKWNEGDEWKPHFTAADIIDDILQRAELGFLTFHLTGVMELRLQEQMKTLGRCVIEGYEWLCSAEQKFSFMALDRRAER